MSLILTKYEDAVNNNVVFDSSKFDYTYSDDDTFPDETQEDFEAIIDEAGETFDVIRQTDTVDGMGTVSAVSESSFEIEGYLMDIEKKDRQVHSMGLAVPGNRIIYLKILYNDSDVVKEGDILVDRNDYKWRVVKIIHEPFINSTEIYKKAVVKSIGLEGSG